MTHHPFPKPVLSDAPTVCRSCVRYFLAGVALCLLPFPALAETSAPLAAAGWLTQSDTPAARERYKLFLMLALVGDVTKDRQRNADLFERARIEPVELLEPAGLPPVGADAVGAIVLPPHDTYFAYELADQATSLVMQVSAKDDPTTAISLECTPLLGTALTDKNVIADVPTEGATITADKTTGAPPEARIRHLRFKGPDDAFILSIAFTDLSQAIDFQTFLAEVNSVTAFFGFIETSLYPVPLR